MSSEKEQGETYKVTLSVELELLYYDRPLCVLFKDTEGKLYLGHFIDYQPNGEQWLMAPIPKASAIELLQGQLDLRSAFMLAPDSRRGMMTLQSTDSTQCTFTQNPQFRLSLATLNRYLPATGFRFFPDEFKDYLEQFTRVNGGTSSE